MRIICYKQTGDFTLGPIKGNYAPTDATSTYTARLIHVNLKWDAVTPCVIPMQITTSVKPC